MNWKFIRNVILLIALAVLCGGIGYHLGTNDVKVAWKGYRPTVSVVNQLPVAKSPADFTLFWTVWDEMTKKYVDKTKLDSQKMVYGAISGMVASVDDPYTIFFPPKANEQSKSDLNGDFQGIGAELDLDKDRHIVIVAPLPDSPSEKAGIKAGDWILKVDGSETLKWTLQDAVSKIRGPKGTTVTLTIYRSGEDQPRDIQIVRDTIVLKSVEWKVVSSTASAGLKKAAYIHLARFGARTDDQWNKVVSQIETYIATSSAQTAGIVLDLRNNPGGYLTGAVDIASEFLPDGVVVKQESYTGDVQTYSINRRGRLLDIPMVALINKGTASASEILTGSLQVRKRAKLIGTQSFGKGSVQEAEDLVGGAGLHVTIAKWVLANDVWIQGKGLTPDVAVENDPKNPTFDAQLDRAVQVLNGLK
jgi:carboxyl-terminal processing protease